MSEPIRPALTPEEWAKVLSGQYWFTDGAWCNDHDFFGVDEHGEAASCLHGQPYGFTREDVEDERFAVAAMEANLTALNHKAAQGSLTLYEESLRQELRARCRRTRSRADRIAALLPPEDSAR